MRGMLVEADGEREVLAIEVDQYRDQWTLLRTLKTLRLSQVGQTDIVSHQTVTKRSQIRTCYQGSPHKKNTPHLLGIRGRPPYPNLCGHFLIVYLPPNQCISPKSWDLGGPVSLSEILLQKTAFSLVVCLFVTRPKWPNTQENGCWLPPSDHIQSKTLFQTKPD